MHVRLYNWQADLRAQPGERRAARGQQLLVESHVGQLRSRRRRHRRRARRAEAGVMDVLLQAAHPLVLQPLARRCLARRAVRAQLSGARARDGRVDADVRQLEARLAWVGRGCM